MEGDPPMQSLLEDGSGGGRVTSRPNGAQPVDFEGWRGGGRGGFVEEIWKVKLESLGPVSLRSKGWLLAELTWDLFSATADVADVNIIFYKRRLNFSHWGLRPARRRKQVKMESCERFPGFLDEFLGAFSLEPSLNFSGGQSVQQSARLHRVCHLLPQEVDMQREQKGWTKIQATASSWGLSQSLSMDLQTFGPWPFSQPCFIGFHWGKIPGPLQKWILEVDGAIFN